MKMKSGIDYDLLPQPGQPGGYQIELIEAFRHPLRVFGVVNDLKVKKGQRCSVVLSSLGKRSGELMPMEVWLIINEHIRGDRDLLLCQDALIEAGYADWARV